VKRIISRIVLRPVVLALLLTSTLAVSPTSALQQIGASRTVLATVVDNRGRTIVDIDPDDLVIRETGQAREVLSVRVADYPIVVVLDNGQGAGSDFDAIRSAAGRFIGRIGHRPVALVAADPPDLVATFEDDRAVVTERLESLKPSQSGEGLFQAVVNASRAVQELGAPFSAIVVVSATPISSVPSELLTPILDSGATVHVVVLQSSSGSTDTGRSAETLRILADETHGQFTTIFAGASYPAALDRLADRLAPELMIEYVVPVGSSSGNDVQLGVRIPGARVNSRGVTR
jgi:hypothetical protein